MANIFERALTWVGAGIGQTLMEYLEPDRAVALKEFKNYYKGNQERPLKVKVGQYDYNLITNLLAVAVDKSVSMLFSGGCEIKASAGEESPEQEYINDVLKANKWPILSHRAGLDGEWSGTVYIDIIPNGLPDGMVRLVLLDPQLMLIETDPQDMERVEKYIYEIKLSDTEAYRKIVRRSNEDSVMNIDKPGDDAEESGQATTWVVEEWRSYSGRWNLERSTEWPYPFPPIIHWQNLPSVHSVYGKSGIQDAIEIQDRFNFISSNISKIIGNHAHPMPYILGLQTTENKLSWGPGEVLKLSSPDAKVGSLEMQSDLASSHQYMIDLRAQVFDLCRVVDTATVKDKVGQLTNFGLRVIYQDALAKNGTKRELYGDAFKELFERILILNNMEDEVDVEWGVDLPANSAEDAQLILADLNAGLISKETASRLRGYQWESNEMNEGEKDLIAEEGQSQTDQQNNALARFLAGGNA